MADLWNAGMSFGVERPGEEVDAAKPPCRSRDSKGQAN